MSYSRGMVIPDGLVFLGAALLCVILSRTAFGSNPGLTAARRLAIGGPTLLLALVCLGLAALSPWDRARVFSGTVGQVGAALLLLAAFAVVDALFRAGLRKRSGGGPGGAGAGDRAPLVPDAPLVGAARQEWPS